MQCMTLVITTNEAKLDELESITEERGMLCDFKEEDYDSGIRPVHYNNDFIWLSP